MAIRPPTHDQWRRNGVLFGGTVRMLAALEARHLLWRNVVLGAGAGQARQPDQERQPALDAELSGRHHPGGVVEAAQRDRDAVAVRVSEEQGRAAVAAEPPLRGLRAPEGGGRAFDPGEVGKPYSRQRREVAPEGFLAHPAVADMRVGRLRVERIADGAALASAGMDRLA